MARIPSSASPLQKLLCESDAHDLEVFGVLKGTRRLAFGNHQLAIEDCAVDSLLKIIRVHLGVNDSQKFAKCLCVSISGETMDFNLMIQGSHLKMSVHALLDGIQLVHKGTNKSGRFFRVLVCFTKKIIKVRSFFR